MKRCARLLLAGLAVAAPAAAQSVAPPAQALPRRAAELRTERDSARSGRLLEYHLARSGIESCERAIRRADRSEREIECREAQRRVDACQARRDRWALALDVFTLDAIALDQAQRHAGLIKTTMPPCPSTLTGRSDSPAEALAGLSRQERQALPGFSVCESYLRALLTAADDGKAQLVEGLAVDLVERCGADHPEYRRQADAALIRMGREPALLDRPNGAAAPASAAPAR